MKRVLITGANSYIGSNVEKWLMKEPNKFYVETLDMKDENWRNFDFSSFDVVFHVAGIAHVSTKKSMEQLYFKVNSDLAIETAEKAKKNGVKQFIFMSSMIVYNSKEKHIKFETVPNPDNFYGLSKLKAEQGIQKLETDLFKVVIIRPPMIYGPNSKGNYNRLQSFAKKSFVFPNYMNKRSMLYIDNLCEFIRNIIIKEKSGLFFPQNKELSKTVDVVKTIATLNKKKIWTPKIFNPIIWLLTKISTIFNKVFSDSYYDIKMSIYEFDYHLIDLNESIRRIEETLS